MLCNSYFSDLRILIPTSEQQYGRGSRYSPVLEQLMKVKPASTKLGRCSKYSTTNSNSTGQRS